MQCQATTKEKNNDKMFRIQLLLTIVLAISSIASCDLRGSQSTKPSENVDHRQLMQDGNGGGGGNGGGNGGDVLLEEEADCIDPSLQTVTIAASNVLSSDECKGDPWGAPDGCCRYFQQYLTYDNENLFPQLPVSEIRLVEKREEAC